MGHKEGFNCNMKNNNNNNSTSIIAKYVLKKLWRVHVYSKIITKDIIYTAL